MRRPSSEHLESNKIDNDFSVGKYTVCPLAKPQSDGGYTATVSIGTGRGNAAHAHVMRFVPLFETSEAALRYATSEGLEWVRRQTTRLAPRALLPRGAAGLSIA